MKDYHLSIQADRQRKIQTERQTQLKPAGWSTKGVGRRIHQKYYNDVVFPILTQIVSDIIDFVYL